MTKWMVDRLREGTPLVAPGAYDALSARLIESMDFEAVYVGGYATSASVLAAPDLGLISFGEMLGHYRHVREATSRPLIVDADTGYGGLLNVERTVRELDRLGVAALHIEDQLDPKRCGHVSGKAVVSIADATLRVRVAADAAGPDGPAIIARTDALPIEGLDGAIARCRAFRDAGADALFVDAVTSVEELHIIRAEVEGPLVFNGASTGVSPLLDQAEIHAAGYSLILYTIEALLASVAASEQALQSLKRGRNPSPSREHSAARFASLNSLLGLPAAVAREAEAANGS